MRELRGVALVAATAAAMGVGAGPAGAEAIYGVTDGASPRLVTFDSARPQTFTSDLTINGLPGGRTIAGIDVRPATLQVVVLDSAGQLYTLAAAPDGTTATLTAVGSGTSIADATDIDVNPVVDRLRVVGHNGGTYNARVNPSTGALVATDGALAFAAGDTNAGQNPPQVQATAYTNAFPASQTFPNPPTTTQFDLEAKSDALVTQDSNAGTLSTTGSLGVAFSGAAGLDVVTGADGTSNRAYATLDPDGSTTAGLYTLDLATGAATRVGGYQGGATVTDLAVAPSVPQLLLLATVGGDQVLTTIFANRPQDAGLGRVAITGLPSGVTLRGIDQRPATGVVYGLGSDSRLYTIGIPSGVATAVGSGPFTPALSGGSFGFDFNPVADRIRIVSDTGQNLRVDPNTGVAVAATPLDPATGLTAAAYTNPVSPAPAATSLFGIDSANSTLVQLADPDSGATTTVGPLNVPGIGNVAGYDIAARFNRGLAVAGVAGAERLYAVNVATAASPPPGTPANGGAVLVGTIPSLGGGSFIDGLAVYNAALIAPPGSDEPGQTPQVPYTPPAGSGPGSPTITPPLVDTTPPRTKLRLRSRFSVKVTRRDRKRPFRYTVRGRVVPKGIIDLETFAKGRVTVAAARIVVRKTKGGKKRRVTRTLARQTVRVGATGGFDVRLTVPPKGLKKRGSGTLRLFLRFNGTTQVHGTKATAQVRYR